MKKLSLIILAFALAGAAATADDYYLCFTTANPNVLNFAKIPGPGEHYDLNIVHAVSIPGNSDALTYDGEHWWIEYGDSVYCFDQNGDYVSDFSKPEPGWPINGMGWDGQYLWIFQVPEIYQRDIYGGPGPYGQFTADSGGSTSIAIVGDKVILGDWAPGSMEAAFIYVYGFDGSFLFYGYFEGANDPGFYSLAYHDGIVWTSFLGYHSGGPFSHIRGLLYDDDGDWEVVSTVHGVAYADLTVCDADFINIAESSVGKIKAYFAEEEMK